MNSDQILLLVAALGVVTIVVVTGLGSKNRRPQTNSATSGHANAAHPGNRAERRKRH
jgi:hypothetical protein